MVFAVFQSGMKRPTRWLCTPTALLFACTGCWEEIRYDPSNFPDSPTRQHQAVIPAHPEPTRVQPTTPIAEESLAVEEVPAIEETPATDPPPIPPPTASVADTTVDPLGETLELDAPPVDARPVPPAKLDLPVGEPLANEPPAPKPAHTTLDVWQLSSKWSFAAAIYAKGLGVDRYAEPLDQANDAAELLQVELPVFPEDAEAKRLQATVVAYLLEEASPQLSAQLAEHSALVDLAVKTHALLLVYSPRNTKLDPIVKAIHQAAENSGLPENLWRSLVDLLDRRADFIEVKQAVFQLHKQVAAHLAGDTAE